jgi:hypothetical protein
MLSRMHDSMWPPRASQAVAALACVLICPLCLALSAHVTGQPIKQGSSMSQNAATLNAAPPPPWPQQFKAVLFTNSTNKLTLIDMYYDWKRGAVAHVLQNQLQQNGALWRVDFVNGTAFLFSRDTQDCRHVPSEAGVPPPDWLQNATFAGQEVVDTFVCNVW